MPTDQPAGQDGITRPRVIVSVTATADGRVTLSRAERLLDDGPNLRWKATWPPDVGDLLTRRTTAIERRHHPTVVLEGSGTFVADDAGSLQFPDTSVPADVLWTDFLPYRSTRWFAVVDARGRVAWTHKGDKETSLLVIASRSTPLPYLAHLRHEQIPYLLAGVHRVDLTSALAKIRLQLGAECLVSEAGGGLNGALLRAGLVDELHIITIPALIGGLGTPSIMDGPPLEPGSLPDQLRAMDVQVGAHGTIWAHYEVVARGFHALKPYALAFGRRCDCQAGCPMPRSKFSWFTGQFGSRQLRGDVVLPTARFLPPDYSATRSEIEHLVASACMHMQVDRRWIDLRLFDGSAEKQAAQSGKKRAVGHVHMSNGRAVVSLDLAETADPVLLLLAIVVHELCHVRLLGEKRITAERKDHERLTDLLTVFFGFGIFSTNAAMRFDRRAGKAWIVPRGEFDDGTLNAARGNDGYRTLGYLSSAEFGYALGCYAWLRRELDPGWSKFVNPGPLAAMRQSLSFLTVPSQPGDLPTQRLLNKPIKVRNATVSTVRADPASSGMFGMALPQAARESRHRDPPDKRK